MQKMPKISPNHPLYKRAFQDFDKENFLYACPPIDLGKFEVTASEEVNKCLRMCVKLKGSEQVSIPDSYKSIRPLLDHIFQYERDINKSFKNSYAHITVDNRPVVAGTTQRTPGFHVDGYQGARFKKKHKCEHSYIFATELPTEFCIQPFFVNHLDDAKHNAFHEFDKQAKSENCFKSIPGHIYLMDPYMVHRSVISDRNTKRLFVRVTIEHQLLDDMTNTVNPLLPLEYTRARDIRTKLLTSDVTPQLNEYGFTN